MISIIIGNKGSGKTKHLVELVNHAAEVSDGHVVCVEKTPALTYDIKSIVRLIDTDRFSVSGFDAFYGFLCGVCAGDHDITDFFIDATFRICGRDYDKLADFLKQVDDLSKLTDVKFTFTISTDKENLPERIFNYCEAI